MKRGQPNFGFVFSEPNPAKKPSVVARVLQHVWHSELEQVKRVGLFS